MLRIMHLSDVKADPGTPEWNHGYRKTRANLTQWLGRPESSYDMVADAIRWEYWGAHDGRERATIANTANALCRLFSSADPKFGDWEAVRFMCRAYDESRCSHEGRHVCVEQLEAEKRETAELSHAA